MTSRGNQEYEGWQIKEGLQSNNNKQADVPKSTAI